MIVIDIPDDNDVDKWLELYNNVLSHLGDCAICADEYRPLFNDAIKLHERPNLKIMKGGSVEIIGRIDWDMFRFEQHIKGLIDEVIYSRFHQNTENLRPTYHADGFAVWVGKGYNLETVQLYYWFRILPVYYDSWVNKSLIIDYYFYIKPKEALND